ncbi:MAG: rod shape-determining protein MreD [Nocardioides sp.]|uniref:rod shape-determining protein MreD n=1 Tax=Nocardioides sp. TaxID=35761 RepID=UPI0039E37F4E
MNAVRHLAGVLALLVALVLQHSLFGAFAWDGVVPDLVLLVVVAAGLARGGQTGVVLGFVGGMLLDLAPPADHSAGRWALALMLVGYIAGRVRATDAGVPRGEDGRPTAVAAMATVAACSFVGTSVFALTGVVLGWIGSGDGGVGFGEMLRVIAMSLVWDVLLAPLVIPVVIAMFARLERERVRA